MSIRNHPGIKRLVLFSVVQVLIISGAFLKVNAHPSPNTLIFLDASPGQVVLEVQIPVAELELAFRSGLLENPEQLIVHHGADLEAYLLEHIRAYTNREHPWSVEINSMRMEEGKFAGTDVSYWEVVSDVMLKPLHGESTRRFTLEYDAVIHQVINHMALLATRNDWENGAFHQEPSETVNVIAWDLGRNVIPPLEIDLREGSWRKGFTRMLKLGMQHISEGTDHLLFLLVLLLPAMLVPERRKWKRFGGLRFCLKRLVKIVTAFTIGHSITLIFGAFHWAALPVQLVEILIAFSILVSSVHAVYPVFFRSEIFVAGGFGLIHGLAFSTILTDLHLGTRALISSLLAFNIGIELMQLLIILMIVPWLILLSRTPVYSFVRIPCALLAAIASLGWIAERVSGNSNRIVSAIERYSEYALWYILFLAVASVATYKWYGQKTSS